MGVLKAPVFFAGDSFLQDGLRGEVEGGCRPARCVAPVYDFLPVGVLCGTPSTVNCFFSGVWTSDSHVSGT